MHPDKLLLYVRNLIKPTCLNIGQWGKFSIYIYCAKFMYILLEQREKFNYHCNMPVDSNSTFQSHNNDMTVIATDTRCLEKY